MQKPLFSKDISLSLFTETEAYRREKYPPPQSENQNKNLIFLKRTFIKLLKMVRNLLLLE